MKTYLTIFIFIFLFSGLYAQHGKNTSTVKWLSIALKGGGGNSILINSDAMDDSNVEFNYVTPSFSYGGRFTITYGDFIGFGVDVMSMHFGQEYSIKQDALSYSKNVKLGSLDIMPFFRYTSLKGIYVEVGPRFSTLKSASETNSIQDDFRPDTDMMKFYENKYTSAVFGAGLALFRTDRTNLNLGFRASYCFSDMIPDKTYYVLDDAVYAPTIVASATTNPVIVQGILEFDYIFAFWGNASCGRGNIMFFQ